MILLALRRNRVLYNEATDGIVQDQLYGTPAQPYVAVDPSRIYYAVSSYLSLPTLWGRLSVFVSGRLFACFLPSDAENRLINKITVFKVNYGQSTQLWRKIFTVGRELQRIFRNRST